MASRNVLLIPEVGLLSPLPKILVGLFLSHSEYLLYNLYVRVPPVPMEVRFFVNWNRYPIPRRWVLPAYLLPWRSGAPQQFRLF
ncbi:hypothetical protein D3C79_843130 [compost metagenome]